MLIDGWDTLLTPRRTLGTICVHLSETGGFFHVRYSTLLHLPPLRFHCVGGCRDRTKDIVSLWSGPITALIYLGTSAAEVELMNVQFRLGYGHNLESSQT